MSEIGDFTAFQDLASCWRGDWSEFDGRTLRDQIDEAIRVARGQISVPDFRMSWGICPTTGAHWSMYCRPECGS